MTRSDIGIIAIIYATCLLFWYMTIQLEAAAQVYPMCLIAGLGILNTLYFIRRLWQLLTREKLHQIINDLPDIFAGFMPMQFFFIVFGAIAFMVMMRYMGFYLSGALYLVATMWALKVRPLPMACAVAAMGALIYGVFDMFLKVPLPRGVWFS